MMGLLSRKTAGEAGKKITKDLTIINRLGLHARPSAMFVKVCSRYKCEIWVEKDGEQVNGKSIMGLMMLAAGQGSKLRITCEGHDAEKALEEIDGLIQRRFDED
jgi:phosphocarrier protein